MHTAKLSIIIPNYNYGHFLEAAVCSIFSNSPSKDCEVIIIDDGSTDNSFEVIKKLAVQFPCIRFFQHTKNLGILETINTGLESSLGEYVHLFASDDLYLPHSLEKIMHCITRYPQISLFCSDHATFIKENMIKTSSLISTKDFHFFSPKELFKLFKHTDFWIPGHTAVIKKNCFEKYGAFDSSLKFAADWYFNHTLALREGVGYIPEPLIAFRKHSASYSSMATSKSRKEVWLHLLSLLENGDAPPPFGLSGIMRMLGVKPIFKDLLKNKRYWKYLLPMCQKEVEKRIAHLLKWNRERYWLNKIRD